MLLGVLAGLPVLAIGNVPVTALARLLETLGAGECGDTHVVVTDVREELVVYINGMPYIRRELEMPAAAMHHAGVHARQLEALEMALKEVRSGVTSILFQLVRHSPTEAFLCGATTWHCNWYVKVGQWGSGARPVHCPCIL